VICKIWIFAWFHSCIVEKMYGSCETIATSLSLYIVILLAVCLHDDDECSARRQVHARRQLPCSSREWDEWEWFPVAFSHGNRTFVTCHSHYTHVSIRVLSGRVRPCRFEYAGLPGFELRSSWSRSEQTNPSTIWAPLGVRVISTIIAIVWHPFTVDRAEFVKQWLE